MEASLSPLPRPSQVSSPLEVERPRLREPIPTSKHPNFRDYGKMVDAGLLRLLCRLQRKHGIAWFAEAGARKMLCEDTGHMPGVGTIPAALRRLEGQGLITRNWCTRGSIKPDGEQCIEGCVLVLVPQARIEPRAARAFAARTPRERIVHGRINPQKIHELRQRMHAVAPRLSSTDDRIRAIEQKRLEGQQGLLELAAKWEREERGPPD